MLRDERGFSRPWKAPSWPLEKKAARAFLIRSETETLRVYAILHLAPPPAGPKGRSYDIYIHEYIMNVYILENATALGEGDRFVHRRFCID